MRDNKSLLSSIKYRPLAADEKNRLQTILATGNLTIDALIARPGMSSEKRNAYRQIILKGLRKHPDCTAEEVAACLNLSQQEKDAVRKVEEIKYRVLEGFVARLIQLARKKMYLARWFCKEDTRNLLNDLYSEAMTAFSHAIWRFNRYDCQFNTFLTTVVNNWLNDYCQKYPTVKMSENTRVLMFLYYSIRGEQLQQGRRLNFDQIAALMIRKQLEENQIDATDENVERATEAQRKELVELRHALEASQGHFNPDFIATEARQPESESMFNELVERLSPLQRRIVRHRLDGESNREVAEAEGLTLNEVGRVLSTTRAVIGRTLATA